jgi:sugar lactone lactonase YvrE
MNSYLVCAAMAATISTVGMAVKADPVAPAGYSIENYATGIGAANALAIGPDGLLYITDYQAGQLLRRTAAGSLEVVASGMPYANGVAFSPSGRLFVAARDVNVYEIVGGTAQVFASGFSYVTSLAAKGDDLYVSSSGNGTISKISTLTGVVTTALSGVGNPFGLSFDALGNLYYIDHAGGALYTYDFTNPPRLLANITPSGGVYTGFGFNGQLFWGDYQLATLFRLGSNSAPVVYATGFAGGGSPPVIGPNGIVAQGSNAILVADGHNVWRITLLTPPEGILHERTMQISQTKRGWVLSCTATYADLTSAHNYQITFNALGPGVTAAPLTATVGPKHRTYALRVPGVQNSTVQFTKGILQIQDTVYLSVPPGHGATFYCQSAGQDMNDGGMLRETMMEDFAQ